MGHVKEMLMDFEEKISLLDNILSLVSSEKFAGKCSSRLVNDLEVAVALIHALDPESFEDVVAVSEYISDHLQKLYDQLYDCCHSGKDVVDKKYIGLLGELGNEIHRLKLLLTDFIRNRDRAYNSEAYYNNLISTFQKEKGKLEEALHEIRNKVNQEKRQNQFQKTELEGIIVEKEAQLKEAEHQIANLEIERAKRRKEDDIIAVWQKKISSTFTTLKASLKPIRHEYCRLNILFWIYTVLTGVLVILIAILETVICGKFNATETFPLWRDYLVLIFPLPVAGALLWAFITQLNRAQRQMVVLAKHIHEIDYIEQLMLAINTLSINTTDSIKRVNSALDKLLENHLSSKYLSGMYDENLLLKEEKKDMIPMDMFLTLLKEIKGNVSK